jgi:hypothetical protein
MFPIDFGVKSSKSRALDIGVEKLFLGPITLSFPPRTTIPHILTTDVRKMFHFEFGVKRSKVKCTGHQRRNMISGL